MAVSIRDIAREAGVTVGTVSHALNNYPDVSPTTRERIVETAQRLGYHPNQMARNLSSKHNHNIALVLSGFLEEELINDFDALLMKGCFHYTVNNDVEMSIQVINTKIQTEKSFEQLCYEHNIAGAILMGLRTNDPYCELLAKSKYPCVTIDIEVPGPNVSCVMMDDIKAFDELTQYLIDMGHRKIVVVHGRKLAMVSMQRLVGAYQAMQRNGLELPRDNIIYTNFGREEARDGVKEYFRTHSPDSATAFLCMSDMLAIGTIEGLKELGYKVPKDYSVVGFDGLEVTNYTDPAITTIDQNIQQKGYEATRLLCDMIRGKRKAQRLVLPHTLTVRDSVRSL